MRFPGKLYIAGALVRVQSVHVNGKRLCSVYVIVYVPLYNMCKVT